MKEFHELCPQSHPHLSSLFRVFSCKGRLADGKDLYVQDAQNDEMSLESDDGDDTCPDGCTKEVFESVLDLRQRRIVLEKELKEFQNKLSSMKRNYNQFCTDEKRVLGEIHEVEHHIQIFQNEKQRQLNGIVSYIPMNSKQICGWKISNRDSGEEPIVVFKQCLRNLYKQANALRDEIVTDMSCLKDLIETRKRMGKGKKEYKVSISRLQKQCEEFQVLKFGRMVNIEAFDDYRTEFDHVQTSNSINEHNKYAKGIGSSYEQEDRQFREEIVDLKLQLKLATEENTKMLAEISDLHQTQISMEFEAKGKILKAAVSSADEFRAKCKEIQEMKKIIHHQRSEIVQLKTQVYKLRRKEGMEAR